MTFLQFFFSADNHTGIAYNMVDSIAALYNSLMTNGLRPKVVMVAHNNLIEYCLTTFTLLSTCSFQSNFLSKIQPKYLILSLIGILRLKN